jgi:hypothetical protein
MYDTAVKIISNHRFFVTTLNSTDLLECWLYGQLSNSLERTETT